jgi:AcrR family transcriptional regulator
MSSQPQGETVAGIGPRSVSPGRPARLTPTQVAETALEIADRDGIDALSMRRVAEVLGVGTMTLYGYFRDKAELLDAVVDAAVAGPKPIAEEGPWRERLRELMLSSHQRLDEHPGLVQIRLRRPVLRPDALRFAETGLGILIEAGFTPAEGARAFRLLFTYLFGFAGLSPARSTVEARSQAADAIAALPPAAYPNLTSSAAEVSHAMAGEEQFAYGLERILDGLEARLTS